MLRGDVPHVVGNRVRAIGEAGRRLRQRQGSPLGLGEVRGIAPDGDRVDALIGFARMLELAGVDVDADAATVSDVVPRRHAEPREHGLHVMRQAGYETP